MRRKAPYNKFGNTVKNVDMISIVLLPSVVEYQKDRDTMFGFGGSINLFDVGKPTVGKLNEIDYKTKEVKVEIDVLSDKPNQTHYRALLVHPTQMFK
ncbi:putative arylsulfate sulfotransferase [Salmonella enterica subsp. enterica]|uniref:Putative arylsulfate sulfotransferase n=1 Tax=Salmonella enterica I TaxID=59201 RepID=A0A3S4JAN0_SALET|nr:putative arylsulfate sulfotransferase [Salmonella enterica subsp. enterica]